jgi:hypothetical protein
MTGETGKERSRVRFMWAGYECVGSLEWVSSRARDDVTCAFDQIVFVGPAPGYAFQQDWSGRARVPLRRVIGVES